MGSNNNLRQCEIAIKGDMTVALIKKLLKKSLFESAKREYKESRAYNTEQAEKAAKKNVRDANIKYDGKVDNEKMFLFYWDNIALLHWIPHDLKKTFKKNLVYVRPL